MKVQCEVSNMINEFLLKNVEILKMGIIEIVKELERGIVDIDIIKKMN